jgi:hypothetical protein
MNPPSMPEPAGCAEVEEIAVIFLFSNWLAPAKRCRCGKRRSAAVALRVTSDCFRFPQYKHGLDEPEIIL